MTRSVFVSLLITLLVTLVSCAGNTATVSSGEHVSAAVSGRSQESSTDDFDVTIDQPDAPMVMPDTESVDVRFAITIHNRMNEPITIRQITLQSLGRGSYRVAPRTRTFDETVEAHGKETLTFWATTTISDSTMGTRAPLTLRAAIDAEVEGMRRKEVFTRSVNGVAMLGISR